jgi:hypothetical protein
MPPLAVKIILDLGFFRLHRAIPVPKKIRFYNYLIVEGFSELSNPVASEIRAFFAIKLAMFCLLLKIAKSVD